VSKIAQQNEVIFWQSMKLMAIKRYLDYHWLATEPSIIVECVAGWETPQVFRCSASIVTRVLFCENGTKRRIYVDHAAMSCLPLAHLGMNPCVHSSVVARQSETEIRTMLRQLFCRSGAHPSCRDEVGSAAQKSKIFGGREKLTLTLTLCSEFCSLAWAARFPWEVGRPRAPGGAGQNRAPLEAATRTQSCELRDHCSCRSTEI
jgi:hypothetical protein